MHVVCLSPGKNAATQQNGLFATLFATPLNQIFCHQTDLQSKIKKKSDQKKFVQRLPDDLPIEKIVIEPEE